MPRASFGPGPLCQKWEDLVHGDVLLNLSREVVSSLEDLLDMDLFDHYSVSGIIEEITAPKRLDEKIILYKLKRLNFMALSGAFTRCFRVYLLNRISSI